MSLCHKHKGAHRGWKKAGTSGFADGDKSSKATLQVYFESIVIFQQLWLVALSLFLFLSAGLLPH